MRVILDKQFVRFDRHNSPGVPKRGTLTSAPFASVDTAAAGLQALRR